MTGRLLAIAAALAAVVAMVVGPARPAVAGPAPALVLEPPVSSPPPAPPQTLPAPVRQVAVLTADSLQLLGLRSLAVSTADTASGPVPVIELVMRASTLAGLDLRPPCAGRLQGRTTAAQARITGGLTLRVTALQVRVLQAPLTLVASALPAGQLTLPGVTLPPLPADTEFLSVTMHVLSIRAGAMALDGSRTVPTGC